MLVRQCRGSRGLARFSRLLPSSTTTWHMGSDTGYGSGSGPGSWCRPPRSSTPTIRSLVGSADSRPGARKAASTTASPHGAQPDRKLATAMGEHRPSTQPFDYPLPMSAPEPLPLTFDPSDVLQVPYPEPPTVQSRMRISPKGVTGNMDEVWPVFDACLRVGKLDRARLFIERLAGGLSGTATPEQMIALHDRYLRASVHELVADPDSTRAEALHTWYEMYIRKRQLPVTAVTIACMLKIAILSAEGPRLEDLVARYMDNIEYNTRLEVLTVAEILSANDLSQITKLSPQNYDTGGQGLSAEAVTENDAGLEGVAGTTPSLPKVAPVNQKGQGLKALKKSLSLFNQIPEGHDFRSLTLEEMREIQSKLERDSLDSAIESWRRLHLENVKRGYVDPSTMFGSILYSWHVEMEAHLKLEWLAIDKVEKTGPRCRVEQDRCLYGPLLQMSQPERVAAAAIIGVINTLSVHGIEKGTSITTIVHQLGKVVEEDIRSQQRRTGRATKPVRRTLPTVLREHARHSRDAKLSAEAPPAEGKSTVAGESDVLKEWPPQIRAKLAGMLVHMMLTTCMVKAVKEHPETKEFVSQMQPAFGQGFVFKKGKKIGTLMANPELVNMMMREPRPETLVRQLPMITPPDPWIKYDKGGYLDTPTLFIRSKSGEVDQKIYAEAAIARGDLGPLFKALDILGRTAWKINESVLNVMLQAWNTGDAIASIPPLEPKIPLPPQPDQNVDPAVKRAWSTAVKRIMNEMGGMRSNRCFINYQLEIARAFRSHVIYFPHNLDFRGRAYPIPPVLNHMGADHARSLLIFGKGKTLGETGLMWLKVHLANVYGFDKASIKEREAFAMEHLDDILDSATNPLEGARWWLKGEDPWQTLATCFELKAALESPDPTEFVSALPVHQDGTCNGLQHYAALGGDSWGARQVNLEPGDRPADVYSAVAELVREQIEKDAKDGNSMAPWLKDKITRKVVKQTVMTNVYGVTFSGARAQIMKQLDDLYPKLHQESGVPHSWLASYIARCVFKALGTMFQGAHDIQYWLGESASRVCRSLGPDQLKTLSELPLDEIGGSRSKKKMPEEVKTRLRNTIVWTTPLRLPVAQPYRQIESKRITTCLQELSLPTTNRTHPVNRRKQLQAFPPNFIHSLDATHMLLSAIQCEKQGLSFAAVHDSFWTHACDVDSMGSILRDAFVRIHEEDVIGRLRAEFVARYGGSIYLAYLRDKTIVGREVAQWRKQKENNTSLLGEGLLEYRRQTLLSSEDPAEVEEGENMVTPASIAEKHGDPHAKTVEEGEIAVLGDLLDTKSEAVPVLAEDVNAAEAEAEVEVEIEAEVEAEAEAADEVVLEESLATEGAENEAENGARKRIMLKSGDRPSTPPNSGMPAKRQRQPVRSLIWLPLEIPKVPPKGDFDVRKLMTSKYFFS